MRILSVHNQYMGTGGEEASRAAEEALLRQHGHDVRSWGEDNRRVAELGLWRTAIRTVWSTETTRRLRAETDSFRPDLVQVQNFFPLVSPSIFHAATRAGIPIVLTLRNFRLLCLNGLFLRDDRPCEDCLSRRVPWPGVRHACYRGSRAGSAAVMAMLAVHRWLHTWSRHVTMYIALTDFARRKFVAAGLPEERIAVKPNFLLSDPGIGNGASKHALYIGRLSSEKGVGLLLDAWTQGAGGRPLLIAGDGPQEAELRAACPPHRGISFLGRCEPDRLLPLLRESAFLVLPSLCYEGMPRAVLEAFACGIPVVASRSGGIPEIVEDGVSGLLVHPGSQDDLARKIQWAWDHPGDLRRMGSAARRAYEARYTAERNYPQMMAIYEHARRLGRPTAAGEGQQPA